MRISNLVAAIAVAASAGACGQDDSQNVMAQQATSLTEAQVERALGPEPAAAPPSAEPGSAPAGEGDAVSAEADTANSSEEEQQ